MKNADLNFHFDPVCPWAYITSRWVVEVQQQRGYEVSWHFISLFMINEARGYNEGNKPYRDGHFAGLQALRVASAARAAAGNDAVAAVYTALGKAIHVDKRRPEQTGGMQNLLRAVLSEAGLNAAWADSADDALHDAYAGDMHVVYTPKHLLHDPATEIEASTTHSPFEHTGRAETIKASLQADSRFRFREPTDHGADPIKAVHDEGLIDFLAVAWGEYQKVVGERREVVPDMFYRDELRNQMGGTKEPDAITARLGWWCFETTTPLTEGTYQAARAAVDTAMT
ncbi:MAG: hypothetical protein EBW96_01285, partial [Actinobacteria bacterium]|nr:hypothetical protein [Actinomycetota bacterium]